MRRSSRISNNSENEVPKTENRSENSEMKKGDKKKVVTVKARKSAKSKVVKRKKDDMSCLFGKGGEFSLEALLEDNCKQQKKVNSIREKIKQMNTINDKESDIQKVDKELKLKMEKMKQDHVTLSSSFLRKYLEEEQLGFVFEPLMECIKVKPFVMETKHRESPFQLVYECMAEEAEWEKLLSAKLIIVKLSMVAKQKGSVSCPLDILHWLYHIMCHHEDPQLVKTAFINLAAILYDGRGTKFMHGLPNAFGQDKMGCMAVFEKVKFSWEYTIDNFLISMQTYGYTGKKREMATKSRITVQDRDKTNDSDILFPVANMECMLSFVLLCLRTKNFKPLSHDAFLIIIFLLRMTFQDNIDRGIIDLSTGCIAELLDQFPQKQWENEWVHTICDRIAGPKVGIFSSSYGWRMIARRFPNTKRGDEIRCCLSLFVLMHRLTSSSKENAFPMLKFPISQQVAMKHIMAITEQMRVQNENGVDFEMVCIQVSFMDLALQNYLPNVNPEGALKILVELDKLRSSNRSTMSAKWHELNTIVNMLRRKYVSHPERDINLKT